MTPQELKAVLAKTKEVAIWPVHIEYENLPYWSRDKRMKLSANYCPIGLQRATVIEDGAKWVERRPLTTCGVQDYEFQRRNGVLVEMPLDAALIVWTDRKKVAELPHTKIVRHHGKTWVQMIISRKAIFAPWDEYALIDAQRQKEREEAEAKETHHREVQAALFGMTLFEFKKYNSNPDRYVSAYTKKIYDRKVGKQHAIGEVTRLEITLEQAEKILSILTPKQRKRLFPGAVK